MSARKLKILADENIPSTICTWLRGMRRIDLETVHDARLLSQSDLVLVNYAREHDRIILAGDKGFAEQSYEVCTHPGIINVSKFNNRPSSCKQKLSLVLSKARRFLGHNIIHLRENDFCVVKLGNEKEIHRYE
jgi:predicted nuclease of predicted toxin-antitoxin system